MYLSTVRSVVLSQFLTHHSKELKWETSTAQAGKTYWASSKMYILEAWEETNHRSRPVLIQFSSEKALGCVWLFATPRTAASQLSLSITNSWSFLKLMSIEPVMLSNHHILCCPLLLPPSIFPSIRVFSNEWVLHIRWPKYWRFSFSISPSNEYSGLILGWTGWISLQSKGLSRVFSNTTVQKHQFFSPQHSL